MVLSDPVHGAVVQLAAKSHGNTGLAGLAFGAPLLSTNSIHVDCYFLPQRTLLLDQLPVPSIQRVLGNLDHNVSVFGVPSHPPRRLLENLCEF